ncbi:MAG: endonuclease domain-containing protein [Actinomycetota bacterium]|nr:endonuclease domain-containing protein [Actinomycetota bacterium]
MPGVFIVNGFPECLEQRVHAGVAWAGPVAVGSHRSAATLLDLDVRYDIADITASIRKNGVPDSLVLHRSALATGDRTRVKGIPLTSASRTLLDLGAVASRDDLELALEAALRKRLTSIPTILKRLETNGRGKRGVAKMRQLLAVRGTDPTPTGSFLETRFAQFARRHRLPQMTRQFEIFDGPRFMAKVDFAIPEARLAIEVLGYRWHSGRKDWHHDFARLTRLAETGWRVMFVTKESLAAPRDLAQKIRRALGQAQLFT